ncbi:Structural maintenance of chromosomes protein 5, partial [Coemansia guatemalensis]
ELETRIAQSDGNRRQIQDELATADREARQQTARFERFETTQRDLTAELDDIKKRAQRRRENIARLRTEIADLEAAHDLEPPDDGSRELAQVGAELNQEKLKMTNEIIQLQDEQKALTRTGRQLSSEMTRSDSQLRDLDNVELQRRETLRRFNEDTFRALEWLEQNRKLFKQHVFSPVCLEASVRDARYANLIETVVGASTLRTFVAQSEEDYHTFTREVNDRQRLRVDIVCFRRALDSFQAPQPRDTLQRLGFDGYVLDFIEAPQAVLAALCGRDKIHEIPLALGRVDSDRIEQQQLFREYIADGTRFTISRGRYGTRAATVVTSRVRPNARLLSAGESDEVRATRSRLHAELDKLRDQLAASEAKMKKLSVREQKVRDGHRAIEAREEELRLERQRVSKLTAAWEREK